MSARERTYLLVALFIGLILLPLVGVQTGDMPHDVFILLAALCDPRSLQPTSKPPQTPDQTDGK